MREKDGQETGICKPAHPDDIQRRAFNPVFAARNVERARLLIYNDLYT